MYNTFISVIFIGLSLLLTYQTLPAQNFELDQLKYPYPTQEIQLKQNIKISYVDEGKHKTTLVFIHGLGSYLPSWKQNIDRLSKNYRCIALDLPGYGKSDKPIDQISLKFYAEIINEFVTKLKLKNVILVGHSMGGQIAITTALKYPELSEKLILFAPAGIEQFNTVEANLIKNFTKPATFQTKSDAQVRKDFEHNFYKMPEEAEFMIEDRIQMKNASDFPIYCQAVSQSVAAMLNEPVFEQLQNLESKTLLIFGENDALIPNKILHPQANIQQIIQTAQNLIPNLKTRLIPDAGHFGHFEKPEEYNQEIIKWITGNY